MLVSMLSRMFTKLTGILGGAPITQPKNPLVKSTQMKLELRRYVVGKSHTIGKLSLNDKFICYTLEDKIMPPGEKIPGETAIPFGIYDVILSYSLRFKQELPLLKNVPNFEGVRIHAGNTIKDTEGCILVGTDYAGDALLESRKALRKLLIALKESPDEITITIS